jgi:hypothetical protein
MATVSEVPSFESFSLPIDTDWTKMRQEILEDLTR